LGIAAAALPLMLYVGGCGSAHQSAARQAADQHFVDGVHESATDIGRYRSNSQLVKLGHATCDGFRANANNEQVAGLLERTGGSTLPPEDLGAVMSKAVQYLCPAYAGRLNPVNPGG
jgi:hypothetical protein